ncbi:MAG: aldehyde dehydrogenase [Bacteroidales bacterium]|nr:aldehyde dehydrogenase [Bacteroidales bacterium]
MTVKEILDRQRAYFLSGYTLNVRHRKAILKILYKTIVKMEDEILAALKADLGKSDDEGYMTELGLTLSEISDAIRKLPRWTRKRRACTPIAQFPARSYIIPEPYGNVLIMSPWNYPFLLCMSPLVAALAAGNTAVIKPSAYSPATSAVIKKLIEEIFTEEYVAVVTGGRDVNQDLLEQKWDYIFFTGSKTVGRVVMEKAAAHLTPVTLELGGKSPVIIDKDTNIDVTAARVVFGKYLNCGQTCVAPDHIFVHKDIEEQFIEACKKQIVKMFGEKPLEDEDYGKIISQKHYTRLVETLEEVRDKVVFGGTLQSERLRIEPTILRMGQLACLRADDGSQVWNVDTDRIMQEEIFGPLMPVISYATLDTVVDYVQAHDHPLACYIFTTDRLVKNELLKHLHFGSACVGDTIIHLATDDMPFGGVGESGMGSYHGKWGFETFSHLKSIVDKPFWLDLNMRYQPYSPLKRKLIKMFLK